MYYRRIVCILIYNNFTLYNRLIIISTCCRKIILKSGNCECDSQKEGPVFIK